VTSLNFWPLSGWCGWMTSKVPSAPSVYAVVVSPGQGSGGAESRDTSGPAGEEVAAKEDPKLSGSQRIFGGRVSSRAQ